MNPNTPKTERDVSKPSKFVSTRSGGSGGTSSSSSSIEISIEIEFDEQFPNELKATMIK